MKRFEFWIVLAGAMVVRILFQLHARDLDFHETLRLDERFYSPQGSGPGPQRPPARRGLLPGPALPHLPGRPLQTLGSVRYGWLVALAAVGAALSVRGNRRAQLLLLMAASSLASLLPFFVTARFRVVAVSLLAVLAGQALVLVYRRWRAAGRAAWPHRWPASQRACA